MNDAAIHYEPMRLARLARHRRVLKYACASFVALTALLVGLNITSIVQRLDQLWAVRSLESQAVDSVRMEKLPNGNWQMLSPELAISDEKHREHIAKFVPGFPRHEDIVVFRGQRGRDDVIYIVFLDAITYHVVTVESSSIRLLTSGDVASNVRPSFASPLYVPHLGLEPGHSKEELLEMFAAHSKISKVTMSPSDGRLKLIKGE
ncbi:MAG: hypothetical protein AAGD32_02680 [Planctomycetota bacterium]